MKKMMIKTVMLAAGLSVVSAANQADDFVKACEGGDGKACATAGAGYAMGLKGTPDMQKAKEYWKKGCDLGNGSACTTYAITVDDDKKRVEILKKACELGNENGCLAYEETQELIKLKEGCIEKDDADSCDRLGEVLLMGGEFETGKKVLGVACGMSSKNACEKFKIIDSYGDVMTLPLVKEKRSACFDKNDKIACEKMGTYLLAASQWVKESPAAQNDKMKLFEAFQYTLFAMNYFESACKLGRKESCRYFDALKDGLDRITDK